MHSPLVLNFADRQCRTSRQTLLVNQLIYESISKVIAAARISALLFGFFYLKRVVSNPVFRELCKIVLEIASARLVSMSRVNYVHFL